MTETLGVPTFTNEFWTSRQRQAHNLHEISYRACFKPQLPRYFIERLTAPGDVVYDPFMGRGTTLVEAALLGRVPYGCDINPLSRYLVEPRLNPPTVDEVAERLDAINLDTAEKCPEELLVFYHPTTLKQICSLRDHLLRATDHIDDWIRMVALNRLTGHSPGFFSVYTLPPNQATSIVAQKKINASRNQTPPERDVKKIILKKTRSLLKDGSIETTRRKLLAAPANSTPEIESDSVALIVTSPPFLDVVDYAGDNWLRCWFAGIDIEKVRVTTPRSLDTWAEAMTAVFRELRRVLTPGGHIAFEVGEVRDGTIKLEETVIPCGTAAGLHPVQVLINDQDFTKTANCWGVSNGRKGTNTNRIVLFKR